VTGLSGLTVGALEDGFSHRIWQPRLVHEILKGRSLYRLHTAEGGGEALFPVWTKARYAVQYRSCHSL